MDKMKAMVNALRGQPAPTGSGMVDKAKQTMQATPGYRAYVIETQSQGGTPVTLQEFMAGKR